MNPKVRSVIANLQSAQLAADAVVFTEGEMPDNSMYFLISGEIGIYKNREGTERELLRMEPGSFFGEMALINTRPRLATARVVSPNGARVAAMNKETLLRLAGVSPEFVFHLLRHSVSRLLAAEDKLERVREELDREKAARRM